MTHSIYHQETPLSSRVFRRVSVFSILLLCALSVQWATHASIQFPKSELLFEQNKGQFDDSVHFVARGKGYSVVLGPTPVIELFKYEQTTSPRDTVTGDIPRSEVSLASFSRIGINVIGADVHAPIKPVSKNQAVTNYLVGEASKWRTRVANFDRIRYEGVLPHIDVEYYGRDGRLEYDFVIAPGGDPSSIQLTFDGSDAVRLNQSGDLVISVGEREIVQLAPVTYQVDDSGERREVASAYTLNDDVVGFKVAAWDSERALVIDPVIEYSRYFGGSAFDSAREVGLDAAGNIYVVSETSSSGLASAGALFGTPGGQRLEISSFPFCADCTDTIGSGQVARFKYVRATNLLVTKFSPDGNQVLWSTYFNSSPVQTVALGVDSFGVSALGEVAFGLTNTRDGLPLANETQVFDDAQNNVYIAKLNSSGDGLVFGTYLNIGLGVGWIRGLDVGPSGEVAVAGLVRNGNTFPVVMGIPGQSCILNSLENEIADGYLALFDTDGDLQFSSCLGGDIRGGSSFEGLRGIDIGSNGDLYVLGYSSMLNFPVVNPIQATINAPNSRDMTISQVDPVTGELKFSTYFGPTTTETPPDDSGSSFQAFFPAGIGVDSGGHIIVSGTVNSLSYPTANAFQTNLAVPLSSTQFLDSSTVASPIDLFVTKLHPVDGVVFSTYLGGSEVESGFPALALGSDDSIYVAAITRSDDYPTVNAIQPGKVGESGLVISKFAPSGALAFSTYLGGSGDQPTFLVGGIVADPQGKVIVASQSDSLDFPVVGSQTANAGGVDVTLTIIDSSSDVDGDGDGVPDTADVFPANSDEWRDTDSDTIGDNADTDDDGDGVLDANDRFPKNANESQDTDNDGAGDNLDEFDTDPFNYFDLDQDGVPDFSDDDVDGDSVPGDQFDYDATEAIDTDFDGVGNNADEDDDGDGFADILDIQPLGDESPLQTYESYDPFNVFVFLSPYPVGYTDVDGADSGWTAGNDQAFRGGTSFTNRNIDDGQTAAVQFVDEFAGGAIKFWYKVDSQENQDEFFFTIDGQIELTASGDTGWTLFETTMTPGPHTLEWRYTKDASLSEGADAAWIDDLAFDADGDGTTDDVDNCAFAPNPDQRDTDSDGFGNVCDADLNNDCIVNFLDFSQLTDAFLGADADADLSGDDVVNFVDIALFVPFFGEKPGPSSLAGCP